MTLDEVAEDIQLPGYTRMNLVNSYISDDENKNKPKAMPEAKEKQGREAFLTAPPPAPPINFTPNAKDLIGRFVGCTATVVLVSPTEIFCANAGDSRAVISLTNGQTVALSQDHKPSNPNEKARIEAAGGWVNMIEDRVCGNLNLSRSLGDFEYKQNSSKSYKEQIVVCDPDIMVHKRQPGHDEILVVACDGIWDCVTNEQCPGMLKEQLKNLRAQNKTAKEKEAVANLLDKICANSVQEGTGTDNMTCLMIRFKDANNPV